MGRKTKIEDRFGITDVEDVNQLAHKFINYLMKQGKKTVAQNIWHGTLEIIQNKAKEDPLSIVKKAIDNVKPVLETRSRRVGGATYQVPVEVRENRQIALAFRWIISAAQKRSEKSMASKLASEMLDAYESKGNAIKKREDTHKMAEANRAFAHYRW